MPGKENTGLYFEIDELCNSIRNVISNDIFQTIVIRLVKSDLKYVTKKNGWLFNWRKELEYPERDVFKLTIYNNPNVAQGLISLEVKTDHVYMHLVESAPFNKGKEKIYSGVPGNLVAFACKLSFQRGHQGNVAFISKTQLINHYIETLGAVHIVGRLMIINTRAALKLVQSYYSNL